MGVNKVTAILGQRGSGKTTYVRNMINEYRRFKPSQKILIVDTLDHPAYRDVPTLDCNLLKKWRKPSMYRIYGSNNDEIFNTISKYLANTLVVFEDAGKYIGTRLTPEMRRAILDSKQRNLDMVFMFHGFRYVAPEFWTLIDRMVLFKVKDHPDTRKQYMQNYDEILAAYLKNEANTGPIYNSKQVLIFD